MAAKATLDGAGAVADDRGKSAFLPPLHPNRITGKCELGSGKGKEKRGRAEPPGGKNGGGEQKVPIFVAAAEEEEVTRAGNLGPP